jgi:hypothetical protein
MIGRILGGAAVCLFLPGGLFMLCVAGIVVLAARRRSDCG